MPEMILTEVELDLLKNTFNGYEEERNLRNIYASTDRDSTHSDNSLLGAAVLSKAKYNSVLDIGCGGGTNTFNLLVNGEKITLLDFSDGYLDTASRRIKHRFNTVTPICVDLLKNQEVIYKNSPYDLVLSTQFIQHIVDESVVKKIIDYSIDSLVVGGLFYLSCYRITHKHCNHEGFFKSSKYGYKIFYRRYTKDMILGLFDKLHCELIDDTSTKQDIIYLGRKL